jgi:hypothetical protein
MIRYPSKYHVILSICLLVSILACNEVESYDEKPIITEHSYSLLQNASGFDTALLLEFTYTDGDGDVGLSDRDTFPPNDKNVLIEYYEKLDGQFNKILIPGTTDTLNFNSRIKRFGNGTDTRAEVSVNINIGVVIADTVRFDYYIVDRKLNKSNRVSTGEIVLNN